MVFVYTSKIKSIKQAQTFPTTDQRDYRSIILTLAFSVLARIFLFIFKILKSITHSKFHRERNHS